MWFYPDGVANILSQNKLVIDSKWKMYYSSDRYYQTNNVLDLSYRGMTSEGRKVTFVPTTEGLHMMDCSEYFEEGKSGCVFSTKITNNNTNFGENMGMCNTSVGKLNNYDGIDTIEASKRHFIARNQKQASRVRRYQRVGGHPSNATLKYSIVTNGI